MDPWTRLQRLHEQVHEQGGRHERPTTDKPHILGDKRVVSLRILVILLLFLLLLLRAPAAGHLEARLLILILVVRILGAKTLVQQYTTKERFRRFYDLSSARVIAYRVCDVPATCRDNPLAPDC